MTDPEYQQLLLVGEFLKATESRSASVRAAIAYVYERLPPEWRSANPYEQPLPSAPASPTPVHVVLIGCSAQKADTGGRKMAARDLYRSDLFVKSLAAAEGMGEHVYIVSAEHGLLHPDQQIAAYDRRLADLGGRAERDAWGRRVCDQIAAEHPGAVQLVILAGREYVGPIAAAATDRGWSRPTQPMEGKGIGERKAWLLEAVRRRALDGHSGRLG